MGRQVTSDECKPHEKRPQALETTEPGLVSLLLPGSGPPGSGILCKVVDAGMALSALGPSTDATTTVGKWALTLEFNGGSTDGHLFPQLARNVPDWPTGDSSGSHFGDGWGRNFAPDTQPRGGARNRYCAAGLTR